MVPLQQHQAGVAAHVDDASQAWQQRPRCCRGTMLPVTHLSAGLLI